MKTPRMSATFKIGAVSLLFALIGYEAALFIHRAASLRIAESRDHPDTVFVTSAPERDSPAGAPTAKPAAVTVERKNSVHPKPVQAVREKTVRRVESFRFDPNTATAEDLVRLGFSARQAASIRGYVERGGRYRRPDDFARSYAVADSVFERLRPFIDIPRTDINAADSADFDALPGIGGYFAAKMVEYRERLGGYSNTEQLMEIYRFDRERYDALKDLITCSEPAPFRLWSLPADSLRMHPYIRSWNTARAIVLFRDHSPREKWSVDELEKAGVISPEDAGKLSGCRLANPE